MRIMLAEYLGVGDVAVTVMSQGCSQGSKPKTGPKQALNRSKREKS
jgi:hypothetical protein